MPTAYISGPLHAVKDRVRMRRFYECLAASCEACGFDAYLPHAHTDPELHSHLASVEVYRRDLQCLTSADLIVAYIGLPSSGVGAELGLALSENLPIVALAREVDSPSRFLLGMLHDSPNAVVLRFGNESDCRQLLAGQLSKVARGLARPVNCSP